MVPLSRSTPVIGYQDLVAYPLPYCGYTPPALIGYTLIGYKYPALIGYTLIGYNNLALIGYTLIGYINPALIGYINLAPIGYINPPPLYGYINPAHCGYFNIALSLPNSGCYNMSAQYGYLYFESEHSALNVICQTKTKVIKSEQFEKINSVVCQTKYFRFIFSTLDKIAVEIRDIVKKIFSMNTYKYIKLGLLKMGYVLRSDLVSCRCIYNIYISLLCQRTQDVRLKCKLLQLNIHASLYLKHDFHAKRLRISRRNKWEVLIIFVRLFSAFTQLKRNACDKNCSFKIAPAASNIIGGGRLPLFDGNELAPYSHIGIPEKNVKYKFEKYILQDDGQSYANVDNSVICCFLPLNLLFLKLTLKQIKDVATFHKEHIHARISIINAQDILRHHTCIDCNNFVSVFKRYTTMSNAEIKRNQYHKLDLHQKDEMLLKKAEYQLNFKYYEGHKMANKKHYQKNKEPVFPPPPPSPSLLYKIIRYFCADTSPNVFTESGCAVCGKLTPMNDLSKLLNVKNINLLQ